MGGRGKSKGRSGGGGGGGSSAPDNSAQLRAMQQQQEQQQQAFAKQQADALAAQEAARKAAEEAARQQAIATQSANARSLATTNQQEISNKLQTTLNTPIQSGQMNYSRPQVSGFNPAAAKQQQAASMGSAGMPAPIAPSGAAIAQKLNQDSGGTNATQNRYTMPNTTGLTFGGT